MKTNYFDNNKEPDDWEKAIECYRKAAEQGNGMAQRRLGYCYGTGTGVAKDSIRAVEWSRKAAEQEDARAQYNLGVFYATGDGVTKDLTQAAEWYRKAAEQGDSEAQYFLGMCYEYGNGVTQDITKAVEWYRKAAEQGHAKAQHRSRSVEIRKVVDQRSIKHVLHFTRLDNLPSIAQYGLLPRHALLTKHIPFTSNDNDRFDGAFEASCLTISWPNYKMFYLYRTANPTVHWVVISFKPNVLWEFECAFCAENAASNRVRTTPLKDRKGAVALKRMFNDDEHYPSRAKLNIPVSFPTNPQAEILLFGNIPKSLIQVVFVLSDAAAKAVQTIDASLPTRVEPQAFNARIDWKLWQPPQPIIDVGDLSFLLR